MTLLDYITFMEDKQNIDKYILMQKEIITYTTEYYEEEEVVTDADGNASTIIVTKQRPVETRELQTWKCTFLEGGGIKKEQITPENIQQQIDTKQAEINSLQEGLALLG